MVNRENVRVFMTNILDQAGPVVLVGEVVEAPVPEPAEGEGFAMVSFSDTVELRHPLRFIAQSGTVAVAQLFAQEEWVKIPKSMAMEMAIHEKVLDMYIKYEVEVFGGGIIVPEEKKIILM